MPKPPTIGDIFTEDELRKAAAIYKQCAPGTFNRRVVPEVVEPAMARINKATGQENDARYMGYMIERLMIMPGAVDAFLKGADEPDEEPPGAGLH